MVDTDKKRRLFQDVKREVCKEFSITMHDFDGPSKAAVYVWARRKAWWLGSVICGRSNPAMAKASGDRCASTVLYGIRAYKKAMECNDGLRVVYKVMERRQDRPANRDGTRHNTQRSTWTSRPVTSQGRDRRASYGEHTAK